MIRTLFSSGMVVSSRPFSGGVGVRHLRAAARSNVPLAVSMR